MSIRSACDKGFTVYLAEQHKEGMEKALGKGVVVGGVITGLLWGADQFLKLDVPWWGFVSTFTILTGLSVGQGAISANSEDLEHKEAFDAVCKKYSEEESGE
ncbi:MAG: hypothetical protein HOC18_06695 [Candidatus Marinimicrobia bacterium]|jgi:hypothetical protein|nr:hypothetical protein [Candidatus Neomarinimicrobiota bacterium]